MGFVGAVAVNLALGGSYQDFSPAIDYFRKLAKNGVKLVSITQEMGDDPMHQMMRQIMALFDEYQSKENAKHVLRALKENARQGFWNGSLPPIGYRTVAAEQRGAKVKKKIQITNPQGFMQVYQMWFMREGINMSMEDLEKIHKKMISYCEKVVNKDGERIQSAFVRYVDDVIAK